MLNDELAHAVRATSCVLDGEIVCLAPDRRSLFNRLLFRRDWPHFIAFDVLSIKEAWPLPQRRLYDVLAEDQESRGYSQMEGRPELFGTRKPGSRSESARPVLCSALQALRHAAF